MEFSFFETLERRCTGIQSYLCVGLDPHLSLVSTPYLVAGIDVFISLIQC